MPVETVFDWICVTVVIMLIPAVVKLIAYIVEQILKWIRSRFVSIAL